MINVNTQELAAKLGLKIAAIDPNGYARTTEHFDYVTSTGYKSFSKNLTLVVLNGAVSINNIKL